MGSGLVSCAGLQHSRPDPSDGNQKRPPVRGFESGDSKILIFSQAEFANYIKKYAA